ncbi:MAG: polyprenyl synthetase family protein [Candidatus Gastranaerophilales bacterium]|nr:polyprenyl synthetase family protein [Candidatus Gastranaerophilales bacterium]
MCSLENIIYPIKDELDTFESNLKNVILSCDNFLKDDILKFLFSNPKRLRPILIFLFSKILSISSPLVQKIALVSELIHSASLIHDDIIDESLKRRNNTALHVKYGSKIAVLEGDLLLSLALDILSDTTQEISKIYSNRIKSTILGELEQNKNLYKNISFDEYIKKTFNKTGNIFMAGLEALFTISGKNKNLLEFMENYSIYFQLKNDIKDIDSDVNNGNYTLVMLYFLRDYKIEDFNKQKLDEYIKKANETTELYKKKVLFNLESISNSIYKETLLKIVDLEL